MSGPGSRSASGSGAAAPLLGVRGPIAPGDLTRLLLGTDPTSGDRLRATAAARTTTRTVRDRRTGAEVPVTATARPVAGFDLVFSAPKSISLLLAIDDPPVSEVTAAHHAAWSAAVEFLEGHTCVVRLRGAGVTGAGYIGGAFAHYVNRDGDPHLHTHVVIANQSVAPDEPTRWRALDAIPLLVGWRRAGAAVYEACLRHELTTRLGLRWRRVAHGGYEVAGISDGAIHATSARGAAVRAHADRPRGHERARRTHRRTGGPPAAARLCLRRAPRQLAAAGAGSRDRCRAA